MLLKYNVDFVQLTSSASDVTGHYFADAENFGMVSNCVSCFKKAYTQSFKQTLNCNLIRIKLIRDHILPIIILDGLKCFSRIILVNSN